MPSSLRLLLSQASGKVEGLSSGAASWSRAASTLCCGFTRLRRRFLTFPMEQTGAQALAFARQLLPRRATCGQEAIMTLH